MGAFFTKFIYGNTDIDGNDVPDNEDIIKLVENHFRNKKDKQNKRLLKKILRG